MPSCCFSAHTRPAYRDVVSELNERYNRLISRVRCNDATRCVIPGEFRARVGQAHAIFEECVAEVCHNDEATDALSYLIESVERTETALSAELDTILTCKSVHGIPRGLLVDGTGSATKLTKGSKGNEHQKDWLSLVPPSKPTEASCDLPANDPLDVTNKSELASCMGKWITHLVAAPFGLSKGCDTQSRPGAVTVFHSKTVPSISVVKYFERINKYASVSRGVLVAAIIYMERAVNACYDLDLTSHTAHRLLITAVAVSAKIHEDVHYGLSVFAEIGGISKQELIRLENTLLDLLCYNMFISSMEYQTAAAAFAALCDN